MADLWIGDKNVIINFIDNVKPSNVVSINWNAYNGSYKIDNITTFKTPLSIYSSNFYCSYKYIINLWSSLQYRKFTIRTGLEWTKCSLQVEKLPQQSDNDFQKYQSDIMKMVTLTEIKQIQNPYASVTISENYIFFIIWAFLVWLLWAVVFFTNKYYKKSEFITK